MAGSTIGTNFKITTWGESHGTGIGVVIDGCPAGLSLCEEDIQTYLNRRKPGQSAFSTPRKEDDAVHILSGVFEGRTTGTPISLIVVNENQHSKDYREIASYYRPGHADFTFDAKYGFRDYRGGGRSSGRETIGRVAAGAVAAKILKELGIEILTYSKSIGPVTIDETRFDAAEITKNPLYMPDADAAAKAASYLEECKAMQNSAGGIIECVITGVPAGIGDPVFEKIDANLAKAIFSIGAVKGFEIGDGFAVAAATGLTNNDAVSKEYRPFKQIVERLNRTYKASYRKTNGFDNIEGANYDLTLWVTYYNFLRPHKYNNGNVLNDVELLHGADNMPGKWQLLIFLGQQTILTMQKNGAAAQERSCCQ